MNSALKDNEYRIPDELLNDISIALQKYKKVDSSGKKRANHFLTFKKITYQNLKRIKNYFDTLKEPYDKVEFELNGGLRMKKFVNNLLDSERQRVENSKSVQSNLAGKENAYNKTHDKTNLSPINTHNNFLTEDIETQADESEFQKVALGLVFYNQKILLLRRNKDDNWGADKWALVGGGIEKDELPMDAMVRELKEETELDVKTILFKKLLVEGKKVEYLYLIKSKTNTVIINEEHQEFKWFTVAEINMETELAPEIKKYIQIIAN